MEWVNVKDRLPPKDLQVLTYLDGDYDVDYYDYKYDMWENIEIYDSPTHWAKLNDAPKD